jgi:hypothetical protein
VRSFFGFACVVILILVGAETLRAQEYDIRLNSRRDGAKNQPRNSSPAVNTRSEVSTQLTRITGKRVMRPVVTDFRDSKSKSRPKNDRRYRPTCVRRRREFRGESWETRVGVAPFLEESHR